MSRLSLTLACILGLMVAACDRDVPEPAQESGTTVAATGEIDRSNEGALMPVISLSDPSGQTLNTGALQGTPVLVNLWATWCAPCIKEMPLLDELATDYEGQLRVLTVSQDMGAPEKVAAFFDQGGYAMLEPWHDPDNELGFSMGDTVLPTTVLYDASGLEVWRVLGDYDWSSEEARAAIDAALGKGAA